ncbi:methyltransferase family protein [Desulfitobacterium sp. Sab5]|uniref:methyltransferase family protein n=1 Tax=Desulfitobacterium nosdiversum TaxID=3375356 RepID=UPI003CEF2802
MKYFIVALLWVGYGVLHSFLISIRFSNWANRILGRYFAYYRLAYNVVSLALLIILFIYTKNVDSTYVIEFMSPWTTLQYGLLLSSAGLILWAFFSYDSLEFIGLRQIMDLGKKKNKSEQMAITKEGLLGVIRHPMYLATLVFIWSLNSTKADILVHLILSIYILIGIRLEERKLVQQFGSAYLSYKDEVPALIPFSRFLKRKWY